MELDTLQTGATGDGAGPVEPGSAPVTARIRGLRRALVLAAVTALTVGGSTALAASPAPSTGTSGTAADTGAAPDPAKVEAAFKAYAACMRDHGIDMPDPVSISTSALPATGVTGTGVISGSGTISISAAGPGALLAAPPSGDPGAAITISGGSGTLVVGAGSTQVDPKFEAADKACAHLLTEAGVPAAGTAGTATVVGPIDGTLPAGTTAIVGIASAGASAADTAKFVDQMKTYASCMRTHGVDVPDPRVDAATGAIQLSMSADPTSDAFRKADAACATDGFSMVPPAGALQAVPVAPAPTGAPAATPGN